MQPVLMVVDMLQDFFREGRLKEQRFALCGSINELADWFRSRCYPVIWVRQEYQPSLDDAPLADRKKGRRITIAGTDGCSYLGELRREPGEIEIVKKRYSAFFGTDLEARLTKLAPAPLVLAGVNTHACVRTAAVDAYQRDMEVVLALDCVSSYDEEYHRETLRYLRQGIAALRSNEELFRSLG